MNPAFLSAMSRLASQMVLELRGASDPAERRGIGDLLSALCRNMEDVAPRNVSVAAAAAGRSVGIEDMRRIHFDDGKKVPGGKAALGIHWEHWLPVAEMKKRLTALPDPTPERCGEVLAAARLCWIMKGEDAALSALGYRIVRPDPEAAYRAAGIEMEYPWEEHT